MKKPDLIIDSNERGSLYESVKKKASKVGLNINHQPLVVGDYLLGAACVEAKSVTDLIQSAYSGHLWRQLENLDKALERYVELGAVSKGLDRRISQEEERIKLTNMVNKSQDKIDVYLDEKSEYELEIKNFEVEVGPLKYISALLYGDNALTFLENAVRWVILILVFVFDPLAVLLVVAANITIRDVLNKRKRIKDKLLRKQRKNKILVKEEPIGDGTARKITKTKNGVTMEYYE